jgi:NitT/TauT family transport system permease protein
MIQILKTSPWKGILYLIFSFIIFVLVWFLFIAILNGFELSNAVLPYPDEVFRDFFTYLVKPLEGATLVDHVLASLFRVLMGCLYAFLYAVPFSLMIASNQFLDRIFHPIIEMLRPVPPIAWIPFAIIAFGMTSLSYSFIIFIGAVFPIIQNTYDAVKRSSQIYRDVGRSLGASRSQILWDIIFPSIVPNLFTGLRISVGVGWMCVIAAEMIGVSNAGIGYYINYTKFMGLYSAMMAGMLMIAFVGLFLNYFFKLLEKIFLKWM